jgi:O-antigen/teichoic acid export membrane protein
MNNGLTTSSIRFISEYIGRSDQKAASALHHWFWVRQWWCVAFVGAIFLLVAPLVQPVGWQAGVVVMAMIVILASVPKTWYLFGVSAAKGYGRFGIEATSLTTMSLASMAGVIVLMLLDAHLYAYIALFIVSSLAHPALLHRLPQTPRRDPAHRRLSSEIEQRIKPHLYWTALLLACTVFYGSSMSMLFLNHHASAETIAFFSVALALTRGGVELLSSGLNSVLMPLMAHGFGEGGHQRTSEISAVAMRMFHFCGLLLTGVGLFWGGPLVLTMYGPKYDEAAFAFRVLVIAGGLTLPLNVLGTLLSTTDKQRTRFVNAAGSLAISALTAWLFIPGYGLHGALLSYAITSFAAYGGLIVATVREGSLVLPMGSLLRLTAAGCAAATLAGCLLLLSSSLWLQFAAGCLFALLYPLFSVFLRAWRASELSLIAQQAHRLGRFGALVQGIERWGVGKAA